MPRQQQRRYPLALILTAKHESLPYLIDSDERLHEVCLQILKSRQDEGWYPEESVTKYSDIAAELRRGIELLDNDAITGVPAETLREELKRAEFWENEERKDNARAQEIKLALETEDGELAWAILSSRSDYEYEGIELTGFAG